MKEKNYNQKETFIQDELITLDKSAEPIMREFLCGMQKMNAKQQLWICVQIYRMFVKESNDSEASKKDTTPEKKRIIKTYIDNINICLNAAEYIRNIIDNDDALSPTEKKVINEIWISPKKEKNMIDKNDSNTRKKFSELYRGFKTINTRRNHIQSKKGNKWNTNLSVH